MKKLLICLLFALSTTVFGASSEKFINPRLIEVGSAQNLCTLKTQIAIWTMNGKASGYSKEEWLEAYPIDPITLSADTVKFANWLVDLTWSWEKDPAEFPEFVMSECVAGRP